MAPRTLLESAFGKVSQVTFSLFGDMPFHTFNGGPFEQEALIIKTCVPIYNVVVCIRRFEPLIKL